MGPWKAAVEIRNVGWLSSRYCMLWPVRRIQSYLGRLPQTVPQSASAGARAWRIGAAITDCVAVLAHGLRLELDRESSHLILRGSHSPITDSSKNYQWLYYVLMCASPPRLFKQRHMITLRGTVGGRASNLRSTLQYTLAPGPKKR